MSSLYRFEISGSTITKVEEFENGVWHIEDMRADRTWSYDATSKTVTRTEIKNGATKIKTFTDNDGDGVYMSTETSNPSNHSIKLYDFTIDASGKVTSVSENKQGTWVIDKIDANETWTFDVTSNIVTKIETENGYTETTLFVKNTDGYFVRASQSYQFISGSKSLSSDGTGDIYYGKSDDSSDDYDDHISGSGSDDYIEAYAGDDVINANSGNDYINAGAGDDRVNGGKGNDMFKGDDNGNDIYLGGDGEDTINYNAITDSITVNLNKFLSKGISIGRDKLIDVEHIISGDGDDSIQGNTLANSINGGKGHDRMNGDGGNDRLNGGDGDDKINGDSGNDRLLGGNGNDKLNGGEGKDILSGGQGRDILTGGAGNDVFVFSGKFGKRDFDNISDFTHGEDKIQLDDASFKKLTGLSDLSEHFTIGTTASDSDDYLIYNSSTGALIYDGNGSDKGGAITVALLGTGLNIDATDFAVV